MAITASQVKELREKTGAGMMDCKKALKQTLLPRMNSSCMYWMYYRQAY